MARAGNDESTPLDFGGGVANRMAETKVPDGYARRAQDVDIAADRTVSRRDGYTLFFTLSGSHSVWTDESLDFALVAAGNTLYRVSQSGGLTAIATNLSGADVHCCMTPIGVYWSDGSVCGGVDVLGNAHPWGVETPRLVTVAAVAGSLPAGTYAVTATFANTRGEGGAPASQYITLTAPGNIAATISTAIDGSIDEARVYVTTADGEELQYAASCTPGATLVIGNTPRGRPLRTQKLTPMPPLRYPVLVKGRLFGAIDRYLVWSPPMYYGLTHPTKNYSPLRGQTITMVAMSEEPGFCAYVGTDRYTYRFAGESIETATLNIVSHVGVKPGSMARVAPDAVNLQGVNAWVPVWIDARGVPWAGLAGGLQQLHDKFAYPQLDNAAAIFDQRDGHSRYIVSGRGSAPSKLAFGDSVTAQVIDAGGGL
jgi:hypothetical protein